MPKKIKVAAAILADYVAHGAANKITIVNAFAGDVILAEVPIDVSFGLYLELSFEAPFPTGITFEAVLNGKRLFKGIAASTPANSSNLGTIIIPFFQMKVPEDNSTLEVFVSAEGYARTRAMQKKMAKGQLPLPTA